MAAGSDSTPMAEITTSLGKGALFLESFTVEERLGDPFSIVCEVQSAGKVDFTPLIGSGVSLEAPGTGQWGRAFHGLLVEAALTHVDQEAVRYRLGLRPWFWGLSLNRNARIFQSLSTQDIIKQVFEGAGVSTSAYTLKLSSAGTTVRNYCVQYNESDFAFVSRLMEEEGIYYFFQHSADQHVMILCDGPSSHSDYDGGSVALYRGASEDWAGPRIWSWGAHVRAAPNKVTMHDFHMKRWGETLMAQTAGTAVGKFSAELFHYPGGYSHYDDAGQTAGTGVVQLRLQQALAEQVRWRGEGDAFGLPVGAMVTVSPVEGNADQDPSTKILVTALTHTFGRQAGIAYGAGDQESRRIVVEGVPSDTSWRPALVTPKPVARGPQVAMVVGRSGEVVDPDTYGRVKVQFPWDRQGEKNEKSSCWVRVSQGWADSGFGQVHLPRIGEEVIVDFFDGDMDRPVITGRVFNSSRMPPYTLPDNKTQSGWKSQTVGDSGEYPNTVDPPSASAKGSNELRFEDKGGSEEVYLHAQRLFTAWYRFDETRTTGRNTTVSVGYNRTVTVKNNESKTVSDGDETHTVQTGKRTTTIKGNDALTVQSGNLSTTVQQGDETREVSMGKRTTTVEGNDSLTLNTGNWSRTISVGSAQMTSPQKISLQVGASTLELTPEGITLSAPTISINGEATAKLSSAMVQVEGEAMVQVQGALVTIN